MHKFTLMLLVIFSTSIYADLGHINLIMTGTVLQESCDISADSKNQTVTIGSFSSAEFKSVGSVT
ncbi:fimbrial protein, partial [Obesumbacterium proteus]|uniref:fimbrial protein n=1 Tax=Obesumbacterium proteus TaxID=82983 RepID=UPI003C6DEDBA